MVNRLNSGQTNQYARILLEISHAVNTIDNPAEFYMAVCASLKHNSNFEVPILATCRNETDVDIITDMTSDVLENQGKQKDAEKNRSLILRVINSGALMVFDDTDVKKMSRNQADHLIRSGCREWIGVPILIAEKAWGAVVVQNHRDSTLIKTRDLDLLAAVADLVGFFIERLQLRVALKQSNEIGEVLREITRAIHSSDTLDRLFKTIHQILGRIMDVSNFFIGVYEKKDNSISFPFFIDEYDDLSIWDAAYLKTNSLTYEVFKALKPVLFKTQDLEIFKQRNRVLGTLPKIWLGIPLMTKTEPIGILVVQHYADPDAFDQKDVDLLCSVSEQIALAIDRMRSEDLLKKSEENHRLLVENAVEGIFQTTPDGRILSANPSFLKIFGFGSYEELTSRFSDIAKQHYVDPEDRERFKTLVEKEGKVKDFETQLLRKDNTPIWASLNARAVRDNAGVLIYYEGFLQDITERKQVEEKLYQLSIHDHLTGLYNRRHIFDRLHAMMEVDRREIRDFSFSIIDLDHFKNINDTYGHQAGDFVLKEFGEILSESSRPYDLAGRYGGEEFVLLAMNIDIEKTADLLERFRKIIKGHVFYYNGTPISITFSAGVANTGETGLGKTVENLIRKADDRLYLAKNSGRDRIVITETYEKGFWMNTTPSSSTP